MTLKFRSQVIKNPDGLVKYKLFHKGGSEHFHVGVWLDGTDEELNQVERVQYDLHPSFVTPTRNSSNRANKFSVTIWTWGMFNIETIIFFKDGRSKKGDFYLSYELPADDGTNYIEV